MKSKFITFFIVLVFTLFNLSQVFGEEFIFEISDLEITENGNIYKGNNRGTIRTDSQLKLISDNFEYLKKINRLEANGDVQLFDLNNNITINAQQIFYLKNEEKIFTVGKTLIKISNKYDIEGFDLILFKNKMILSSKKNAIITDNESNTYKLEQFQYSINQEILKGENIVAITSDKENKSDKFFLKTGFFDLKKNEFLGKDITANFHKDLFGDNENDPRISAVSGFGDKVNTYFKKGVFTSCKKTDKCPPWKITSDEIHHDKIKKQINYKNAWLEIYDFPVVYFPKFFHPDPSVKRQSGFLMPSFQGSSSIGGSLNTPYFHVLDENKDLTIKPRFFSDNKLLLQTEYREINKDSSNFFDFSFLNKSGTGKKGHFFSNFKKEINFFSFDQSDLDFNFENSSNNEYLKTYKLKSPLIADENLMHSYLQINSYSDDVSLNTSIELYEDKSKSASNKYEFIYPSYSLLKEFNDIDSYGRLSLNSYGYVKQFDTNVNEKILINDFSFNSYVKTLPGGFTTNYSYLLKNSNTESSNSSSYKEDLDNKFDGIINYKASLPLIKETENYTNLLNPTASFRYSPNNSKNMKNSDNRINVNNVFALNRLGTSTSVEGGSSITYGLEYSKADRTENEIISASIANIFRPNQDQKLPKKGSLNDTNSDVIGLINLNPSEYLNMSYDF